MSSSSHVTRSRRSELSNSSKTVMVDDKSTDEDPSPHAQRPLKISDSESDHDVEQRDQKLNGNKAKSKSKINKIMHPSKQAASNGEEDPEQMTIDETESSAMAAIDTEEAETIFYSDADIDDLNARLTEEVSKMPYHQKRNWEGARAEANFNAGKPKHFKCSIDLMGDPACTTLQEYMPTRTHARTAISGFFGHNKTEWLQIPKDIRVYLCRECYLSIEKKTQHSLTSVHLVLCRGLLNNIEQWRPNRPFKIQLQPATQRKIDRFHTEMENKLSRKAAATKVDAEQEPGKDDDAQRANNTPVLFAIEFRQRFCGEGKTLSDVRAAFDWIDTKIQDETIKQIPGFEALLEARQEDKVTVAEENQRRSAALKTKRLLTPKQEEKDDGEDRQNGDKNTNQQSETTTPAIDRNVVSTSAPSKRASARQKFVPPASPKFNASGSSKKLSKSELNELAERLYGAAQATSSGEDESNDTNPDPFVAVAAPAKPKIKLRLSKVSARVEAPSTTTSVTGGVAPLLSKKRKQVDTPVDTDASVEEVPAPMANKAKRVRRASGDNRESDEVTGRDGSNEKLSFSEVKVIFDL